MRVFKMCLISYIFVKYFNDCLHFTIEFTKQQLYYNNNEFFKFF